MKRIILLMLVALAIMGCLREEYPFLPFEDTTPTQLRDGWETSTPEQEGIDKPTLEVVYQDIHADKQLWPLRSMLVIKNGKLVAENYFKDENDLYEPRPIWSCTKQVLGLLTGLALEQGYIQSLDDPISDYLTTELQGHDDKKDITLRQFLTMQSGIDFDERTDVSALLQHKPENTLDYLLSIPILFPAGDHFRYNSGDPHYVAASIQKALGQKLSTWADTALFSKIGFTNYSWLTYDEFNFGGYGISTTPREFAKIAQLVLNKGQWNGEQLVDSLWVQEMTATQVETSATSAFGFGYLWWNNEGEGIHFMAGSGGQYALIDPEKQLLVVITCEHDTDLDAELEFEEALNILNQVRGAEL